ncbi:hypothetical protein B0H14DRAFT_3751687 [Mycena olivaceomarginata]|nr:hypothetical protein B0H14DRAFT_3751687 [Mycena olivaceomarginata]
MPGTHLLPPNLLKLFAPRPPLPYTRLSTRTLTAFVPKMSTAGQATDPARGAQEKTEDFKAAKESYKPADDPEAVGDPYKTLFISRLHKTATESDLRREFETYGTIERVRIVRDKKGRSRGYAFVVYERERDMKGPSLFPYLWVH